MKYIECDGAYGFVSGASALFWSADVMRQRRLPRVSPLWREIVRVEQEDALRCDPFVGRTMGHLPVESDMRYFLAIEVDGMMRALGPAGALLRLRAWGDWTDESRMQVALLHQEQQRRLGRRVRLNYRYSLRQLAVMYGLSAPTVSKRLGRALDALEARLRDKGLLLKKGECARVDSMEPTGGSPFLGYTMQQRRGECE